MIIPTFAQFARRINTPFSQTLLTNAFIIIINVLTGIVSARILGAEGRGIVAAIVVWPQLVAYLSTLGTPTAIVFLGAQFSGHLDQLIATTFALGTLVGCIAGLIVYPFIPLFLKNYDNQTVQFVQLMMMLVPISLLGVIVNAGMQLKEDYFLYNLFRYFPPVISLIVLLILMITKINSPYPVALGMLLPQIPLLIFGVYWSFKNFGFSFVNFTNNLKNIIKYGLRVYGIDIARTMSDQIDRIIVIGILTPALMGVYVVSLSISRMLNVIQNATSTTLLPKLTKAEKHEIKNITLDSLKRSSLLSVIMIVVFWFLGALLIPILYGREFAPAVGIFRTLLFEALFTGLSWVLSQALLAYDAPGIITMALIVSTVCGFPLLVLLAEKYGLLGVGFSLLIISFVKLFITYSGFSKIAKSHGEKI